MSEISDDSQCHSYGEWTQRVTESTYSYIHLYATYTIISIWRPTRWMVVRVHWSSVGINFAHGTCIEYIHIFVHFFSLPLSHSSSLSCSFETTSSMDSQLSVDQFTLWCYIEWPVLVSRPVGRCVRSFRSMTSFSLSFARSSCSTFLHHHFCANTIRNWKRLATWRHQAICTIFFPFCVEIISGRYTTNGWTYIFNGISIRHYVDLVHWCL